jgi:hypothetical protein
LPTSANLQAAIQFEEAAALIEEQSGNSLRSRDYLKAAETLRKTSRSIRHILETEGEIGLERLPGIGEALARQIRVMLASGRLPVLERLRGETDAVALLASVPGIGRKIAERLHHDLGIDTLEDLERAAHDGRLELLAGFGTKKVGGVLDSLQGRLGRGRRGDGALRDKPSVEQLLSVDAEYREKAEAGELRVITPRNDAGEELEPLPVLHTRRGEREFMAVYSNSARAQKLGKTRDWVVIWSEQGGSDTEHCVVTCREGPLAGKRVVRGRESECRPVYYAEEPALAAV